MTVKCLNDNAKAVIVELFVSQRYTLNDLVRLYGKSRRTVIRVLEDAGVDPGVKHRPPKPFVQPLETDDFANTQPLYYIDEPTEVIRSRSWFRRVADKVNGWMGVA